MFPFPLIVIAFLSALIFYLFFSNGSRTKRMNLPGGSLGYPMIGETLSFLKAQAKEQGPRWFEERIAKHGNVFKTSILGSPTVVITGTAGNKFIFTASDDALAPKQPVTLRAISGEQQITELTGFRFKQVKGAMMNFLKPESLQHSIKKMDEIIKELFIREVADGAGESGGDAIVKAVGFMKKLTFKLSCDILFGVHEEQTKLALFDDFTLALKAVWSLPINLPGTEFWRGIKARSRIVDRILPIIREKRKQLEKGSASPGDDVVSCLLSSRDEDGKPLEEQVVTDNFVTLMIASHDTSAILASLMIWKLSKDPHIYAKVLQEQMAIKKRREGRGGERLTWEDIQSMKYTWRVAQELMRIIPPVFGTFRRAIRDLSFDGYDIPKGWQVFWAAYATQMDGDIFENPDEFDPSRFDSPSNKAKVVPPFAYVPFGAGTRMCPGNEFARVETLVIMHNLVTMYEWTQMNPDEEITRQPMPYPSMGLPIKLKPISITT